MRLIDASRTVVPALLAFTLAATSYGQRNQLPTATGRWVQTAGPPGGADLRIELDPVGFVLYAGGRGGGVYRSTDDGATWSMPAVFMERWGTIGEILIDPVDTETLYVLGAASEPGFLGPKAGGHIYKSTDGADSWIQFDPPSGVTSVAISPTVSGRLIAANEEGQIFITEDGGATPWLDRSISLPSGLGLNDVAAAGSGEFWAAASGATGLLYVTTNSGVNWTAVALPSVRPPKSELLDVDVDPANDQHIYVTLSGPDAGPGTANLFFSDDGGTNWTNASAPHVGEYLRVVTIDTTTDTVYAAAGGLIWRSPNHGAGWEQFTIPPSGSLQDQSDVHDMAVDPRDDKVVYIPTNGLGIVKTTDYGQNWSSINEGIHARAVGLVAVPPTPGGVLYCNGGRGVYKSLDSGNTWQQLDFGAGAIQIDEIAVDPTDPNRVWVATDIGDMYESLDAGASWTMIYSALRNMEGFRYGSIYSLAVEPGAVVGGPDVLCVGKNGFGIWRSVDGGDTWSYLTESLVDYTYTLAMEPGNAQVLYSGYNPKPFEDFAMVRKSADGGATWTTPLSISGATGVTSIAIDPKQTSTVYAGSTGAGGGTVWVSQDAGTNWAPRSALDFANVHAMAAHPADPSSAIAALWGNGTWVTEDSGNTWFELIDAPTASVSAVMPTQANPPEYFVADRTTPRIYRATGHGSQLSWTLLFDAGTAFYRVLTAAIAPSDPSVIYTSVLGTNGPMSGSVFRIVNGLSVDVTGSLPTIPVALAIHPGDPNTVYVSLHGAGSGIYKTQDGGAQWTEISGSTSGLPQAPEVGFFGITIDPTWTDRVYLFGGSDTYLGPGGITHSGAAPATMNTVYVSVDGGNQWADLNDGTLGANSGPIKGLAVHPTDPDVVFLGALNGAYRSVDGGVSWVDISAGLGSSHLGGIALSKDGTRVYGPTLGAGMFVGNVDDLSFDVEWLAGNRLSAPVHQVQILAHPTISGTVYASAYPGGVFRSVDWGNTWSECNFGLPTITVDDPVRQGYYAMAIAPAEPDVMYLGIYQRGVYKSTDGAATWFPVHGSDGIMYGKPIASLLVDPLEEDEVYAATEEGVLRTTDGAATWYDISTGLDNPDVRVLAMKSDRTLLAGTRGNELYEWSAVAGEWDQMNQLGNLGHTWHIWDRGMYQFTSILFHPFDKNIAYIGTFPTGIYRSDDAGKTWRERNVGFTNDGIFYITFHPDDPTILFAGTYNGINRSIDGGMHWHTWDEGWPDEQWVFSIVFDPWNPDVMYACSKNGENKGAGAPDFQGTVMKSGDGGETWSQITDGLDDQEFFDLVVDPWRPGTVYLAAETNAYISRDGGNQWEAWDEGLSNKRPSHPIEVTNPLTISHDGRWLYLGSDGSGLYRRLLRSRYLAK